jgi:hypothetical protein
MDQVIDRFYKFFKALLYDFWGREDESCTRASPATVRNADAARETVGFDNDDPDHPA